MGNNKIKGSIFRAGHQPFAQALLKNRNIRVRSVGTQFFNASDFPILYWMTGFAKYYDEERPKRMHLQKHVLGAWDLREEEVTTNEDIVIASTPDWVTRKYQNILDGGLLHEMFHTMYTTTGKEPDFDRISEILQRQYDPEIPYHQAMRFIKHLSNIFEDGYIERLGMKKFAGAIYKLQTVHELVWEHEKYKRRYRPMDSPMVDKNGDPIKDDDGEPLVVKVGEKEIPQTSMSLMGHIGCYLRDEVEDYLKRRPVDEYHPTARKIVDNHLSHIIDKAEHAEDSYDCWELALETLNALKDFFEELPEMPQGGGEGGEGDECDDEGEGSEGDKQGEGEGQGQGKTKLTIKVGGKSEGDEGDSGVDDLPDPEDVDEVEIEYADDDDDDEGENAEGCEDEREGSDQSEEGDEESSESDSDAEGEEGEEGDGKEGESEGGTDADGDDGDDGEKGSSNQSPEPDPFGDQGPQDKQGEEDSDGTEDGTQLSPDEIDKLKGYLDKFPDMLKAFKDDEDLSSAIKEEWDDQVTEDAPTSVLPFSRDYDNVIKIERGNDRELAKWNKLEKEVLYETTYIRPRLLSYFRGKQKKRMRHRQRRGRRLSSRSVAEVVYKERPRPFMNKTQTERKDSAVSLLLDESGSMGSLTTLARKILVTMALTIGELKIPMEVIGFTTGKKDAYQQYQDDYPNADIPDWEEVKRKFTRTGSCDFRIFREFDEPFSVQSYRKMMQTGAFGGTPLADGIEFAAKRLVKRPEEQKVLFVVTDGYPNSGLRWTNQDILSIIRRQTEELSKDNVDVLFIGTAGADFVDRFPHSMFIKEFDNFSQKMANFVFEQMKRKLR